MTDRGSHPMLVWLTELRNRKSGKEHGKKT